jgi:hypothetical protein
LACLPVLHQQQPVKSARLLRVFTTSLALFRRLDTHRDARICCAEPLFIRTRATPQLTQARKPKRRAPPIADTLGQLSAKSRRCKIALVSTGPQLVPPPEPSERNWLPLAIAAAVVVAIAAGLFLFLGRGKSGPPVAPVTTPLDPYAASLAISNLAMSESSNLAGGKVTYLDGVITNTGNRTITAITAQVIFRDYAHQVAWNETEPVQFIRTRDPYVDTEPVSAAPLKPGDPHEFRLAFDSVPDSWDGALPEIRILHVEAH